MHADPEDLAALALDPDGVGDDVRDHVASCATCRATRDELLAAVDAVRLSRDDALQPPPEHVRHRIMAEVAAEPAAAPVVPLATGRRRSLPVWVAGVAAATTLVAGIGIGRFTAEPEQEAGTPTEVVASADLSTVEGADPRGLARAVSTIGASSDDVLTLRVDATSLGGEEGLHEVWLLNVDGTRMVAVGLLAAGDEGEFQVPRSLLDEGYRIVDISVEPDDGDPTHSGVSLARGELA